ncbi:hypothetical protein H0H92_001096 [Tricholoma furcatifolium]|nr:hypothetical protein H0H92_001096 [Tricholoma furcatifolium]
MKEPSSSSGNREERRRSRTSIPYSDRTPSRTGNYSGQPISERPPHKRGNPKRPMQSSTGRNAEAEMEYTETPWMDLLKKDQKYNGVEHRLHHEILAYLTYMEQTPQEKKVRNQVLSVIRGVVSGRFYGANVSVYGSSATGLCLPTSRRISSLDSDMDVALTIPRVTEGDVKRTLFQLSSQFRSAPFTSNVFVNHRAHVPILMLEMSEEYGSISVDMNVNNASGAQGVEVIKGYLAKMPALRPLVLLLKGFLRQRNLNDAAKGGLGSYALICLCIHFLQANPSNRPQEYIEKPIESESLGFLLTDFMFYYGLTFPYTTSYISCATSPGVSTAMLVLTEKIAENEIAKSVMKVESFLKIFKDAYAVILQFNSMDKELLGQIIRVNKKKFLERRTLISQLSQLHTLPARPSYQLTPQHTRPSFNGVPRAPQAWKNTPSGPSRKQHSLSTASRKG